MAEGLPSQTTTDYWIYHDHKGRSRRLAGDGGKWMLFYDKEGLDLAWQRATAAFEAGDLPGVVDMKISTYLENPRASDPGGVLILYCEDSQDRAHILQAGHQALAALRYSNQRRIWYKTAAQTRAGTRATGNTSNSAYSLDNPFYVDPPHGFPRFPPEDVFSDPGAEEGAPSCSSGGAGGPSGDPRGGHNCAVPARQKK